jgi:hypothetical protein
LRILIKEVREKMFSFYRKMIVTLLCSGSLLFVACSNGGEGPSDAGQGDEKHQVPEVEKDAGTPTTFVVKGTSGKDVLLDRKWKRGCIPGTNGNTWMKADRTLTGLTLVTTLIDYQNTSTEPDCTTGRVGSSTITTILKFDNVQVPFTWVGFDGKPGKAPPGLENITKANGATATNTKASITPETQVRADQLNKAKLCSYTDWKAGEAKDTLECFGGSGPAKGTVLVDDREKPWKVYDGNIVDPSKYPTTMPNYLPHAGPFAP